MKVQDIMTGNPRSLTPDSTAREAAQLMKEMDAGVVPIVESASSRRLVGVVTDRDLAIRLVAEGRGGSCRVSEVMSAGKLATCAPSDDVDRVMETMSREQVRRIRSSTSAARWSASLPRLISFEKLTIGRPSRPSRKSPNPAGDRSRELPGCRRSAFDDRRGPQEFGQRVCD